MRDRWESTEEALDRGGHGRSTDLYTQALVDVNNAALGFPEEDFRAVQRVLRLVESRRQERSVDLGSSVVG